jgi:hypothetical protein
LCAVGYISKEMLVCVECGSKVDSLYKEIRKGDIRLTICGHCHRIADKYIEWDIPLLIVDLILQRPPVYRHILFNRFRAYRLTRGIFKLLVVTLSFDSFDRWYLHSGPTSWPSPEKVMESPVGAFTQWLLPHENQWTILITSLCESIVYLLSIFVFVRVYVHNVWGEEPYDTKTLISAIVLSCFSKLGVLMYMVFEATLAHRFAIAVITLLSNIVAVRVFLGKLIPNPSPVPTGIILCAQFFRLIFAFMVHRYSGAHFQFSFI